MRKATEINRIQVLDSAGCWIDVSLAQVDADDVREFDPHGNLIAMPSGADGRRVYAAPKLIFYPTPCIMCNKLPNHPELDDPDFPPVICVQV